MSCQSVLVSEREVIWSVSLDMYPSSKHMSCLYAINCLIPYPDTFCNNYK